MSEESGNRAIIDGVMHTGGGVDFFLKVGFSSTARQFLCVWEFQIG